MSDISDDELLEIYQAAIVERRLYADREAALGIEPTLADFLAYVVRGCEPGSFEPDDLIETEEGIRRVSMVLDGYLIVERWVSSRKAWGDAKPRFLNDHRGPVERFQDRIIDGECYGIAAAARLIFAVRGFEQWENTRVLPLPQNIKSNSSGALNNDR